MMMAMAAMMMGMTTVMMGMAAMMMGMTTVMIGMAAMMTAVTTTMMARVVTTAVMAPAMMTAVTAMTATGRRRQRKQQGGRYCDCKRKRKLTKHLLLPSDATQNWAWHAKRERQAAAAAHVFQLKANPNAATIVAATRTGLSPLVLLGIDDVIVLIDMHSNVRRIGMFLFDSPAVTLVIANDCGRGVRT